MARVENPVYAVCIHCHERNNISKEKEIPRGGYVCYKYKCQIKKAKRSGNSLKAQNKIT
jgi:cytochrome c553